MELLHSCTEPSIYPSTFARVGLLSGQWLLVIKMYNHNMIESQAYKTLFSKHINQCQCAYFQTFAFSLDQYINVLNVY